MKEKKAKIYENDMYTLIQRYDPTAILTLFQEISQATYTRGGKVNWEELVKETATGITTARECQMLWRHIAYQHPLEKIEDDDKPLDDDSDLEIELEVVPANVKEKHVVSECVKEKFLKNAGVLRGPTLANQTAENPSAQPSGIGTSTEGSSGSGVTDSSLATKKKRKTWTEEEDIELIAAVDKFGEGNCLNWASILKGDFKCDRTASQLSQRWAIIRKRNANKSASSNQSERLATQNAISLALDMPKSGKPSGIPTARSFAVSATTSETLPVSAEPLSQLKPPFSQAAPQTKTSNKPLTTLRKSTPLVMSSSGPFSSIQAAAFAAGGRIATPSTAASLLKAAQSKKAVHIRPGSSIESFPIANKSCLLMTDEVKKCGIEVLQHPPLENTTSGSEKATGQRVDDSNI